MWYLEFTLSTWPSLARFFDRASFSHCQFFGAHVKLKQTKWTWVYIKSTEVESNTRAQDVSQPSCYPRRSTALAVIDPITRSVFLDTYTTDANKHFCHAVSSAWAASTSWDCIHRLFHSFRVHRSAMLRHTIKQVTNSFSPLLLVLVQCAFEWSLSLTSISTTSGLLQGVNLFLVKKIKLGSGRGPLDIFDTYWPHFPLLVTKLSLVAWPLWHAAVCFVYHAMGLLFCFLSSKRSFASIFSVFDLVVFTLF